MTFLYNADGKLYYPRERTTDNGDEFILWFALEAEYAFTSFEKCPEDKRFVFATGVEIGKECTVTFFDGETKQYSKTTGPTGAAAIYNAFNDARALFDNYMNTRFPIGPHWIGERLYKGDTEIGYIGFLNKETKTIFFRARRKKDFWAKPESEEERLIVDGDSSSGVEYESMDELKAMALKCADPEMIEKEITKARRAKTKKVAAEAALLGMPKLKGTSKQKSWAEDIRNHAIKNCTQKRMEEVKDIDSAKWWIENRAAFGK